MTVKGGKTWTKRMIFHSEPNCWLERAITELESRPQEETRGRKPLDLTDEEKDKRTKILMRRASIMQRFRNTAMYSDSNTQCG